MPYAAGTELYFPTILPESTPGYCEFVTVLDAESSGHIVATDSRWAGYEVEEAFRFIHVDDIEVLSGDFIVDGVCMGITVRTRDQATGIWFHPRQLPIAHVQNISADHLHFEDRFGNPLGIYWDTRGLNPYSDFSSPKINDIALYPNGSNTEITAGSGTYIDPIRTGDGIAARTEIDLLADLEDTPSNSTSTTMPTFVQVDTFDEINFGPVVDTNVMEFDYFSNEDHTNGGYNTGVNTIFGPGTTLSPTVFNVWATNNFDTFTGGSGDFIRNLQQATLYRAEVEIIDPTGNSDVEQIYFYTGPDIAGTIDKSNKWDGEINIVGDVTVEPDGIFNTTIELTGILRIKNAKNLTLKDNTVLVIQPGATVILEDDGEIIEDGGTLDDRNGNFSFSTSSCILVKNEGLYKNSSSNSLTFDNGSFLMVENGGTVELPDADIYIRNGSFWHLKAGATIKMAASRKIIFDPGSYILSEGSATDPVTFMRKGALAWQYIELRGDNNTFQYTLFDGGDRNLYIRSRNNTLTHVTSTGAQYGLYAYANYSDGGRSLTYISDSDFSNNSRYGIYASNADLPLLSNNMLTDNGYAGLYLYNATGTDVRDNLIEGNSTAASDRGGLEVGTLGWLDLGGDKRNTIRNNDDHEVKVTGSGSFNAGEYAPSYCNGEFAPRLAPECKGGYNNFYDTSDPGLTGKYIYNGSSYDVIAHKNYWGGPPTSSQFYGTVDFAHYLFNEAAAQQSVVVIAVEYLNALDQRLETTRSHLEGLSVAALEPAALSALYRLQQSDRDNVLGQKPRTMAFFAGLIEHAEGGQVPQAVADRARWLVVEDALRHGRYVEAWTHLTEYTPQVRGVWERQELLLAKANVLELAERYAEAEEVLGELRRLTTAHSELVDMLIEVESQLRLLQEEPSLTHLAVGPPSTNLQTEVVALSGRILPVAFALEPTYPNPFEQMTTVPFALPETSQVRIEVYDVLGRHVAVLADGRYEAGRHAVSFDAGAIASGLYLIRAQIASGSGAVHTFTQKLTLMK